MDSLSILLALMQMNPFIVASSLGIVAHRLVFIYGEWHLKAPTVFSVHVLFSIALTVAEVLYQGLTYKSFLDTFLLIACYLGSLSGSIVVYRLYFHRLRSFPGPRLAAASKLWNVWKARDSRNHIVLNKLYEEYGSYVRTGPCEITIYKAAAFDAMDGPKSNTTRTDWYDLLHPRASSIFTRDKAFHDQRRRIWSHALSSSALAAYDPRIMKKIGALNNYIDKSNGAPLLVNDLMRWLAFDLMGAFAFNEDFGMMEKQEYHSAINMVSRAVTIMGPISPAIWIARLGFAFIPGLWKVGDWFGMLKFCDSVMDRRMNTEVKERDLASWFIAEFEKDSDNENHKKWMSGDAATIVVAGSDTTAPTLTLILYFLAKNPQDAEIIYEELSKVDSQSFQAVAGLPHLTGAINEAMRLLPAVPSLVTRLTPPEGVVIDGVFIPGNVKICAPRYTIGRLESAWKKPLEFCPERWYSKRDMIIDETAFAPFGVGKTSCVGKNLALREIRMVIASLLTNYRLKFKLGDKGEAVERDLKDQITANPGELHLIFERRKT